MDPNTLPIAMVGGNFSLILVLEITRTINQPRKDCHQYHHNHHHRHHCRNVAYTLTDLCLLFVTIVVNCVAVKVNSYMSRHL